MEHVLRTSQTKMMCQYWCQLKLTTTAKWDTKILRATSSGWALDMTEPGTRIAEDQEEIYPDAARCWITTSYGENNMFTVTNVNYCGNGYFHFHILVDRCFHIFDQGAHSVHVLSLMLWKTNSNLWGPIYGAATQSQQESCASCSRKSVLNLLY